MKKILILALFIHTSTFAQNKSKIAQKCNNIYVWDFLDQDKSKNRTTQDLTEAVEEALINTDECLVLQRRNLATLVNHAANERGISSVKDMKYEITHALSGNGAKLVLFGAVDMSARDACELKLRVEELATSRIVTAKSTRILYAEIANIDQRNIVVARLVSGLLGKVYIMPQTKKATSFAPDRTVAPIVAPKTNITLSPNTGFEVIMGSCIGDRYNQTVTVSFTFVNNNPNLKFTFPDGRPYGFATDDEGTQYLYDWISLGGQVKEKYSLEIDKQFFTGTKLKASIRFINVLPQVKMLKVVKVPFSKQLSGTYDYIYSDLVIRDLGIQWK